MRVDVDAYAVHPLADVGGAAPQQRAHAREQLGEPEGLGDVVVGTGIEADHCVHFVGARGQDQHREAVPFGTQPPAHLQAVHPGQTEVEDEQVHPALRGAFESAWAVLAHLDLVALSAQRTRERFGDGCVVLGEQYAGHDLDVTEPWARG